MLTDIFTKQDLIDLRTKINELKDALNVHIGESDDIHPITTVNNNGFMSPNQLANFTYLTTPGKDPITKEYLDSPVITELKSLMAENDLPSGTTLWYYGSLEDLNTYYPGWELTSTKVSNPLYAVTIQPNGGELRGLGSESEVVGTVESNTAESSIVEHSETKPIIRTMALWSIRKK